MTVTQGVFEWDTDKDELNIKNHGLSFSEVKEVFDDPYYYEIYDILHSDSEDRYSVIGRRKNQLVTVVVYTPRGGKRRLVTARYASKRERGLYYERIRENYFTM